MTLSLGKVAKGVLNLGIGEFLARLCTIATIVLLGHRYGAAVVGVFTLGMTISFYVQPVIDFGARFKTIPAAFPAREMFDPAALPAS